MFNYVWPIALVVLSNVVYQICAKNFRNRDYEWVHFIFMGHISINFGLKKCQVSAIQQSHTCCWEKVMREGT